MKVLRLHAAGELRLDEEPIPVPQGSEALLAIKAVGVCGSDIHWVADGGIGDSRLKQPLVLGHEFSGVVESGPLKGKRVAVDPAIPCGHCEFCHLGDENFCQHLYFAGQGVEDGALAQYVAWPEEQMHLLPDSLSDCDGAMLEPLGVALHALDLGKVRPGMSVGVYGCGPIGLLIVQLVRLSGATRILATDPLEHRLDAAQEFGATRVFEAFEAEEAPQIVEASGRGGVDVAFEVAGEDAAVTTAVETCRPGGKVIQIGISASGITTFPASPARRKGITIKVLRRMRYTYPRAIHLVQEGVVDIRSIVTHRFPLSDYEEAFATAASREGLKVMVELG